MNNNIELSLEEAVSILRKHNIWRRGDNMPMFSPKLLGAAIDMVTNHFPKNDDIGIPQSKITIDEFPMYDDASCNPRDAMEVNMKTLSNAGIGKYLYIENDGLGLKLQNRVRFVTNEGTINMPFSKLLQYVEGILHSENSEKL
jgi:hypothetical protein